MFEQDESSRREQEFALKNIGYKIQKMWIIKKNLRFFIHDDFKIN